MSLRAKEGYFIRDERLAYGPQAIMETITWTCCHCNTPVIAMTDEWRRTHGFPPRVHPRGYCQKCDALTCNRTACNLECRPFQQFLDTALTHVANHPETEVFLYGPNGERLPFPSEGNAS